MDYDYSNMNQKNNGYFLYNQNDNTNIYQYSDKNNSYTTGKNNIYSLKEYNNQNNNVYQENNYDSSPINEENLLKKNHDNYNEYAAPINLSNNKVNTPQYNEIE